MQVIAFILAIAAAVGFLIDAVWHKSITAAAVVPGYPLPHGQRSHHLELP